jgi:hypothetical protein
MSSNAPPDSATDAVHRAARDAGLATLLARDPALVAKAHALARGYAERLRRPDSPLREPAHVYCPRRDT